MYHKGNMMQKEARKMEGVFQDGRVTMYSPAYLDTQNHILPPTID